MTLKKISEDDADFRAWIIENPKGFILNTENPPNKSTRVIHRPWCRTMQPLPQKGLRSTYSYMKVCATSRGEIEQWTAGEFGLAPTPCPMCKSDQDDFRPPLQPGDVVDNSGLMAAFNVGIQGGMRPSKKNRCLVLVSDPTKGLYQDRWIGDILHYTGKGKAGDQKLADVNLTLAECQINGIAIYLFEVFEAGAYTYVGQMTLAGHVYQEKQVDEEGRLRQVYMFPLRIIDGAKPVPEQWQMQALRELHAKKLAQQSLAELLARAQGANPNAGEREVKARAFIRDEAVAAYVKAAAAGKCDLCQQPAPFENKGQPFLECHHILPLADGGEDSVDNAVALCPNCHRKMHALKRASDKQILEERVKARRPETGKKHGKDPQFTQII